MLGLKVALLTFAFEKKTKNECHKAELKRRKAYLVFFKA